MQSKLILLIGPEFISTKQIILELFKNCHCVFAEDGIRGLATAMVMKPDVVVCGRDTGLMPTSLIKYEVMRANSRCKFLIIDEDEAS